MIQVDEATNALLDEDAIIQEERQRLADLQSEWEEKLRTAELEFSVERAKIARTQSELEEQKQELASMQSQHADATKDIDSGGRWFKKLGLGGDEN